MNIFNHLAVNARRYRSGNLTDIKCVVQPKNILPLKATRHDWFIIQQCCNLENEEIADIWQYARELGDIFERPRSTIPWKEDVWGILEELALESAEIRYSLQIPLMASDWQIVQQCLPDVDVTLIKEKVLAIALAKNRPQNLYRTDIPVEIWKSDLFEAVVTLYPGFQFKLI